MTAATEQTAPAGAPGSGQDLLDPGLLLNRELSWLEYDARVLEEARDPSLPVLERLRFLGIATSNLDEFFMVRVAGLKQMVAGGVEEPAADGLAPRPLLAAIAKRTHALVATIEALWRDDLAPELTRLGHVVLHPRAFTAGQAEAVRARFAAEVLPVLTPLAVDPGHPFPQLRNKSLNVALFLRPVARTRHRASDRLLAVVQVPSMVPRLVELPGGTAVALLEEVIAHHAAELFPGYAVLQSATFRVTRNWDLALDEEESEDLLSTVQAELRRRDRGAAVRLEIAAAAGEPMVKALVKALGLEKEDVYRVDAPLQPQDLARLAEHDERPELRAEPFPAVLPPALQGDGPVHAAVAEGDVLLHHPYQSYDPVIRFVEEAADDPDVLAIKQTLYRTGAASPFARALSRAAENGKQVTALVEIKARFDEANNIAWARKLEESGVHVVYGLVGLKTHCKVALVVRREAGGLRRYVHVGTGDYNPVTARAYTDLSLFSAEPGLCDDVAGLFNLLTGYAEPPRWRRLAVAPFDLQARLLELIAAEAEKAARGEPGRIAAKMSSLVDPEVIRALYAASRAGATIDLAVRGICCLRPGLPGVSERIRVTSVVDRFLEHDCAAAFGEGESARVFLSSADWMPRNFKTRVEVLVPVLDPALRARVLEEVLGATLADGLKAWRLEPGGAYRRVERADGAVRSQEALAAAARRAAQPPVRLRPVAAPEP